MFVVRFCVFFLAFLFCSVAMVVGVALGSFWVFFFFLVVLFSGVFFFFFF